MLLNRFYPLLIFIVLSNILYGGNWEGTYLFQEKSNNQVYQYELTIFEHELRHTAEFTVKSSDENYTYECEVNILSEDRIDFVIERSSKGKGPLKKGDIICGFEKKGTTVLTLWRAFNSKNNLPTQQEYFRLDQYSINYMKKYNDQLPYEVAFFRNPWIGKHMQLALGTKYDGLMTFLQVEDPIKLKDENLYIEGIRADMEGQGNAGKNIIVVDLENKIIYVSYVDGHQKISHFRSGNGPQPKVLTNWINKQN